MTSPNATLSPAKGGANVISFPLTERAVEAAIRRQAFALDPPELAAFARVLVLALTPERPVRAADVIGDPPSPGFAKRNVEDALSSLKKRGLISHTRAGGYVPTPKALDPYPYVLRDPQPAAGCGSTGDQGHNAEPPCDLDEKPADPLAAVKAYEAAARVSLRSRQWEEKHVHAFYWARPEATEGELRQALAWIIPNWKLVLKGREFAALWADEYDDDGYQTRRRTAPPAAPEPKFLGRHADLFWKAWDAHQQAERVRAEEQRQREQEAQEASARAAQYARDQETAHAIGLTVEEWRTVEEQRHAEEQWRAERERERKLAVQRANNPAMVRLMAASAARRECDAPDARAATAASLDTSAQVQHTPHAPEAYVDATPEWTPPDIVLPALPDFECPIRPVAHWLKPAPRPDPDPDFDFADDPDFDGDLE